MNAPEAPSSHGLANELALLRRLARLSAIGAWHCDLATGRVTFSTELLHLHDLDPATDVPPQDLAAALCLPEERAHLRSLITRAIEHGEGWDCELPVATARGRRLWVRVRGEPELHDCRCVALAGTCEDITTQRELRVQARTAATRVRQLAAVAASTDNLVLVTDHADRIEWVNVTFTRITGYGLADVIGQPPLTVLRGPDSESSLDLQRVSKQIRTGQPVSGAQLKLYRKDRTPYWAELEVQPIVEDDGALVHHVHVQSDRTSQHVAGERLRELSYRLRLVVRQTGVGTFERDLHTGERRWDERMFRLFGLPPKAATPELAVILERIVPEDRARYAEDDARQNVGEVSVDSEFRVRNDDGRIAYLHVRTSVQRDSEGVPVRVVGAALDITAKRLAEEQARFADEWVDLAINATGMGLFVHDPAGAEPVWDARAQRLLGFDPGHTPLDFNALVQQVDPTDRERFVQASQQAQQVGKPPMEIEFRWRRSDGQWRWLRMLRALMPGAPGQQARIVGALFDLTEVKQAQMRERDARQWLQLASGAFGIGFWHSDLNTQVTEWDAQAKQLFDLPPTAPTPDYDDFIARIVPEDRERVRAAIRDRISAPHERIEVEYRIARSNGEVRHVLSRRAVAFGVDGTPLRQLGATIDITASRVAQQQLRELDEWLQLAGDATGIGFYRLDAEGATRYADRQVRHLFGFPVDGPPPSRAQMLAQVVPEDRALALTVDAGDGMSSAPAESEFRLSLANGEFRSVLTRQVRRVDEHQRVLYVIGAVLDITDRVAAERARLAAEQSARDLLQKMQMSVSAVGLGFWEVDLAAGAVTWNEQMYRLYGQVPTPLSLQLGGNDSNAAPAGARSANAADATNTGHDSTLPSPPPLASAARQAAADHAATLAAQWLALSHPDDPEPVLMQAMRAVAAGQPLDAESKVILPDGSVRHLAHRAQVQLDASGRPARQMGVTWDITERNLAQAALLAKESAERASAAKSEFLSRMSHELRTPLNAILGFAQILEMDVTQPLPEAQRERVSHIASAGWHLLSLINEILDLARIEAGAAPLELQPVRVAELVGECLLLISTEAALRRLHLAPPTASADSLVALADRMRLKQVLLNLLSNAVKYNRDGGAIVVSIERRGDELIDIAVRDTGVGMSAAQIEQLFEPFNRLGREGAAIEGSGIGLSIARTMIDQMGGQLRVASAPGQGTAFNVLLPVAVGTRVESASNEAGTAATLRGDVTGAVLYVEDNATNVEVLRQLLKLRPKVTLITAENGARGLVLAAVCQPDLILLDMRLPDIDGLALLQKLRFQRETASIPCVGLSANAVPSDIEHALRAGLVDYWTKPLQGPSLLRALDHLLTWVATTGAH